MKLFIIACEPSGDQHAAHLIHELKTLHPNILVKGLGGPRLQEAGAELLYDMTQISALGLGDVLRQYFLYRKIFYATLKEVASFESSINGRF